MIKKKEEVSNRRIEERRRKRKCVSTGNTEEERKGVQVSVSEVACFFISGLRPQKLFCC